MKKLFYPAFVLSLLVMAASVSIASAATCTVTTAEDRADQTCDGDCSLREAILEPTCTMINFSLDLAGTPIVLSLGELVISRSLVISGWGADAITISGNHTSRIFYIGTGAGVTISGVTLKDGNGVGTLPNNGGAIRNRGSLDVNGVFFTGNHSPTQGGAISFEGATSTIRNSTFTNNSGGGFVGAVVAQTPAAGVLHMQNSTISGNAAPAVYVNGATIVVTNSTLTGNGSMGVYNGGGAGFSMGNSIVEAICRCNMLGGISSSGNNIASASSGSNQLAYHTTDLVGIDPQIGGLQDNGGHFLTILPLPGSPAIDGGNDSLANAVSLTTDARGFSRFAIGPSGRPFVDIGATEYNASAPAAVTVAGRVIGAGSGNPLRSVSVKLTDMQGNTRVALSSSLGWFVFDNLPAGFVYRVSVTARRGTITRTVFADQSLFDTDILIPGS